VSEQPEHLVDIYYVGGFLLFRYCTFFSLQNKNKMRQLGTEEKAALLLAADDDDDDDNHEMINSPPSKVVNDNFPTIAKRPRTYHRRSTSNTHPILCFTLIMGAFVLGCVSGVVIILYRMSQDTERGQSSPNILQKVTNVDLSIRTKLFESITKTNFRNFNR